MHEDATRTARQDTRACGIDAGVPGRRRPAWRRPGIVLSVLLALALTAIAVLVLAMPDPPVPRAAHGGVLDALERGDGEDRVNGAPALDRALAILEDAKARHLPAGRSEVDLRWVWTSRLYLDGIDDWHGYENPAGARAAATAVLDDLVREDAFSAMETAANADFIGWTRGPTWSPTPVAWQQGVVFLGEPHMTNVRSAQALAAGRTALLRRAIRRGDTDAAAAHLDVILRFSDRISGVVAQGSLRSVPIGGAATDVVIDEVAAGRVTDPGLLRALARVVDDHRRVPTPPPVHLVELSRHHALDAVQHCWSDDGAGGGVFVPSAVDGWMTGAPADAVRVRWSDVAGRLRDGRREIVRMIEERHDEARRRLEMPPCAPAPEAPLPHFERLSAFHPLPLVGSGILRLWADGRPRDLPRMHRLLDAKLAAAAIVIAIARHQLDHGEPPAALADLVPAYLDALPEDPIGCAPFGYRRLPEVEAGYRLWSIGFDRLDAGGTSGPAIDDIPFVGAEET